MRYSSSLCQLNDSWTSATPKQPKQAHSSKKQQQGFLTTHSSRMKRSSCPAQMQVHLISSGKRSEWNTSFNLSCIDRVFSSPAREGPGPKHPKHSALGASQGVARRVTILIVHGVDVVVVPRGCCWCRFTALLFVSFHGSVVLGVILVVPWCRCRSAVVAVVRSAVVAVVAPWLW